MKAKRPSLVIVDVRQIDNGEVIGREFVEGDVATAFLASLFDNNRQQVTVVFANGQVRGLEISTDDAPPEDAQRIIREFGLRKHNLLEELKNYEKPDQEDAERSQIPANTVLDCGLDLSLDKGLCLQLSVTNNIPIRSAVIFAEGVFPSESYVIHPNFVETSELAAYICPGKDMMTDLHIKVLVGFSYAKQLHVFEVTKVLPRFATYLYMDNLKEEPQSYVEFDLGFRPDNLKFMDWLLINFILSEDVLAPHFEDESGSFRILFMCMRNHEGLVIEIGPKGECVIRHNDIDACGGLLQSLAEALGITELKSSAHFPACLQIVQNVINTIDEKYEINDRLAAEWADRLNAVRETTVRAEDFLVLRNATNAKKLYVRMAILNREIVQQHAVRMNAREALLDSLKLLNVAIEQNARLRIGNAASELIKECRKAIVMENNLTLPKLLQYGV
uniref:Ciliary BBSome complex subunit 2 C-terminal domain-containing protein n=1 Tax=Acrobeloides nanus TaxID=290746 RepID=A0A914EBM6_9BILA